MRRRERKREVMTQLEHIQNLEAENARLREKLATEKLVCRAKCLLVERQSLTEAQAHRYIEKMAMDTQGTRRSVAERVIKMYT